jgi:hypothetical protein
MDVLTSAFPAGPERHHSLTTGPGGATMWELYRNPGESGRARTPDLERKNGQ